MTSIELNTLSTVRDSIRQILPTNSKPSRVHLTSVPLEPDSATQNEQTRNLNDSQRLFTKEQRLRSRMQFLVTCCCMFAIGFNDASAGPLLPRMQSAYQISFVVVSLVFIFSCVGFLIGACLNVILSERVTFGKLLSMSCIIQMIAFTLLSPAPPFPVFVLGYFINGIGTAIQLSQVNGYMVTMGGNINTKVSISQASYGAGALVSPLVATQFSVMRHWSFHYLVALGIVTVNAVMTSAIFRLQSQQDCRASIGLERIERDASEHSPFKRIMSLRSVHILAAFIFLYVGTEVTIGGWTVTYIIQQRDGGAQSGYIASGFWAGIMLGRIILIPLNKWLGDRLAMSLYILLAIGLEIIVWFVPSLIGDAVAVSLVGLFFGPIFPIALSTSRKIIPRWIFTGAIGWITGIGQAGSAAIPFITGALSDAVGIRSLQPLLVAMMATMIGMWFVVPRPTRPD